MRDDKERQNAAIHGGLARLARFDRPARTYFLLTGAVAPVSEMSYPGDDDWRNPDLFWPDDRQWFVATDVDFWSLYIGGSRSFVDEIAGSVSTRTDLVDLDLPLEIDG